MLRGLREKEKYPKVTHCYPACFQEKISKTWYAQNVRTERFRSKKRPMFGMYKMSEFAIIKRIFMTVL